MIRARMCAGARWTDVCLLNLSERGLGLQSAAPPPRGTYVEVRRGRHVIIGRVMWAKGHRFGLRAQDRLPVDAVVREPDLTSLELGCEPAALPPLERRSAARPRARLERHESSRILSRALEFGFVLMFGGSAAVVAFQSVEQALAAPLAQVSAGLEGR